MNLQNIRIVLLLVIIVAPLPFFFSPLWGIHAGNSADRGYAGYVLATEGFIKHRFGHYTAFGEYYTHHPPLAHLITGLSFKIFGDGDIANRIPPYLFSVAGAIFFYLLIGTLFGKRIAFAASILYVTSPVYIYYGSINIHENYSVSVMLGSLWFFAKYNRSSKKSIFLLCSLLCVFIASLSSWHIIFLYFVFATISLVKGRKFSLETVLFVISLLGIIISMRINSYTSQTPFFAGVKDALFFRVGIDGNKYSLINSFFPVISRLAFNCVISLGLVSLIAIPVLRHLRSRVVLSLLFYPAFPVLIFSNAFYIHEYLFIYALPIASLASGVFAIRIFHKRYLFALFFLANALWISIIIMYYLQPQYKNAYLLGGFIRQTYPDARGVLYVTGTPSDYSERVLSYYARKDVLVAENCNHIKKEVDLVVYRRNIVCAKADNFTSVSIGDFVIAKN
jgi:4-amino-4-deoxy-L-arabinose transferase-like glycosyltransferase